MNDQDKEHMRIMFAGFIVCGMIMKYNEVDPEIVWKMADDMLDAKDKQEPEVPEVGIVAAKTRRRK